MIERYIKLTSLVFCFCLLPILFSLFVMFILIPLCIFSHFSLCPLSYVSLSLPVLMPFNSGDLEKEMQTTSINLLLFIFPTLFQALGL